MNKKPSLFKRGVEHIKKSILTLVVLLIALLIVEGLRVWEEHTFISSFHSIVTGLGEIKTLQTNSAKLLAEVRANSRVENDEFLAAVPPNQPPVVLAIFPPTTTSSHIVEGLDVGKRNLTDECSIEYLREAASVDDTIREIRSKLSKENIVLIIGHESSQIAKEINDRLYEAKEFVETGSPIPLILPAATNPELTKSPSRGIHHILRLPATDEQQIARIKHLLGPNGLKSQRATLVVDASNLVYADYIARGLTLGEGADRIFESVGVGLASDGFLPSRFMSSNPDTIVFIGMAAHANLMLRRLAEDVLPKYKKKLNLIFTDGVAGNDFQVLSRSVSTRFGEKVRLFITGPFPTSLPKGGSSESLPNFRPYGVAARELAGYLVRDAHDFDKQVTRQTILKVLQRRLDAGPETMLGGLKVRFDANGDIVNGEEHVYEQGSRQAQHSTLCSCRR